MQMIMISSNIQMLPSRFIVINACNMFAESGSYVCRQMDVITYLIGQSARPEITKRKLESSIATLNIDLEGNQRIWSRGCHGRHDRNSQIC